MPFTMDDFKKLDSRLNTITSQKVEEFEISLDTPPTLEELPDSNKAYSLYASILFIDIRKSTQLVEESQARSMVKVYRAFMRMAVSCVRSNGGVTRQFLGDRIMGVFLDSKDDNGNLIESSTDKAVRSAQAMQTSIDFALNKHLKNNVGGKTISCGIGIDYGKVLLTKVGMYGVEKDDSKENETDCVWVGNCTNRASKYSDLADGGEIFISENVYNKLSPDLKPENVWIPAAKHKANVLFNGYRDSDGLREIGIRGDCVYAIYTTPLQSDTYECVDKATYINTYLKMLNNLLALKKYPTIAVGIGVGTAEELIVKAGRKDVGINNPVWIGDAVTGASNLSAIANKDGHPPIAFSDLTYANTIEKIKEINSEKDVDRWFTKYSDDKLGTYYCANIVKELFNDWIDGGMKE